MPRIRTGGLRRLALFCLAGTVHAQDVLPPDPPATPSDADATRLEGVRVTGAAETGSEALYLDEKRIAPTINEALGAVQIARTGDSDAATTLKRLPGLSLIDGRHVYVRGLGERYSSVLLNGAQIPSPDFTRRVVPLDLFPTELLDGIIVQKSYSADMPGEFGGGTVMLRTRQVPRAPFFRVQGTVGYADGTTFEDGLRYHGGDRDWTGADDGARAMPGSLAAAIAGGRYLRPRSASAPGGATPAELQTYGRDLAEAGFGMYRKRIGADTGLSFGAGNSWQVGEDVRLGLIASARYSQDWETREERRNAYAASSAGLTPIGSLVLDDTRRSIDTSGFIGFGADFGMNHHVGLTLMQLRQTDDRARISDGSVDSVESRFFELRWTENELIARQLSGRHTFPGLHDLQIDWQYTKADAGREEPNRRNYRYDYAGEELEYSRRSDANSTTFGLLDDGQDDASLRLAVPFDFSNGSALRVGAGVGRTRRDREATIRNFAYQLAAGSPLATEPGFLAQPIDLILHADNIRDDGFVLREVTRPTDNYFARQTLESAFLDADYSVGRWRFMAGARREDNRQSVTTYDLGNAGLEPIVASDDRAHWLPAAGITYALNDDSQLRLGYSRTLSRPDFRELSNAPFTDPELDIETIGNPDLRITRIRNIDLRWEYYFSGADSVSVALFDKRFADPIEKLRVPGSSPLLELANAASARNYGIEIDLRKSLDFLGERSLFGLEARDFHVGFNYARIRSSIDLDPASASYQTNLSRPMQGQSPYVVNFQLGYDGERHEATLLYGRFGQRISEVGVQGQPDIVEQSYDSLDAQWRYRFLPGWRLTVRLRNLLDPTLRYTQGGLDTRSYERGREASVSLEWRPALRTR